MADLDLPTREAVEAISRVVAEKFHCKSVNRIEVVNGGERQCDYVFHGGEHVSEVVAYALVIYKNINEGR